MILSSCTTLLGLGAILTATVAGQPLAAPSHFYPYGPGIGDRTVPPNDDGSSGKISISTQFPYFDDRHDSLYVDTNGLISFLREVSQYTPAGFPLAESRRLVAAFWADVDTRKNSGRVYYRETADSTILQRATDDVRRAFVRLTRFTATWVYIASWHKVTYFGGSTTTPVNTFQIVLITNGRHSFTIFNYGNISWTTGKASGGNVNTGTGGTSAQVGFNAGDGRRYFSVPGSRQAAIIDVETTTNVGRPGRWMFRIDDVKVESGGCNTKGSLAVGPSYGPMLGGLAVTVSGPCFDQLSNTSNVVCSFNGINTPAEILDATRALCILPMVLKTGRIPVGLSVDGGQTFTHTGVYSLVGEYNRHAVKLINGDSIDWGDFDKRLQITWPRSYFNTSEVDVDFVIFSYKNGSYLKRVQMDIVPLARSTANHGSLTLSNGLSLASVLVSGHVGAILVRPANSSNDEYVKCLWSNIHYARWYQNMYLTELLLRGSNGATFRQLNEELGGIFNGITNVSVALNIFRRKLWKASDVLYTPQCNAWYKRDIMAPPSTKGVRHCPCTRRQARVDIRFEDDPSCSNGDFACSIFQRGAHHCIRSVSSSTQGAGQQCCYDRSGNLLPFENGGGTFDRAHAKGYVSGNKKLIKIPYLSHLLEDVEPSFLCCKLSFNCQPYNVLRPTDDCRKYVPPVIPRTFGDPHIVTMDGLQYTFNGLGEFWLIRSAEFLMQGRATQATNNQGNAIKATIWTALSVKTVISSTVQVQVNKRTGLDIIVDGVKEDFDDLPTQEFPGVTVTFDVARLTADIRFHTNDFAIKITTIEGALSFEMNWPRDAAPPAGLLGNANGNIDDDLQNPDQEIIAINSTAREVFEKFGMTWQTTEAETGFVYDSGSSYASFINPSFQPIFEPPTVDNASLANVTRVCDGVQQCIFDYFATGKLMLALATSKYVKDNENYVNASQKVITCGFLETPSNCSKTGSSALVGSVITFSCNDGFTLQGSAQRQCTKSATWDGEQPVCVADQSSDPDHTESTRTWIIVAIVLSAVVVVVLIATVLFCCGRFLLP